MTVILKTGRGRFQPRAASFRRRHIPSAHDSRTGGAGVYHYAPLHHTLEQRARWLQDVKTDASGFHVGLTSITWREAWKYGERAFRYCQHDVGHALATLRFAAAALGWRVQLLPVWDDALLARLLGLEPMPVSLFYK